MLVKARVLGQIAGPLADLDAVLDDILAKDRAPAVGRINPSKSLMAVVFPDPFGPKKPKIEFLGTFRSRDLSACTPL